VFRDSGWTNVRPLLFFCAVAQRPHTQRALDHDPIGSSRIMV
jgi:hypothetical protein